MPVTSTRRRIFDETLLTFCPPGPEDRTAWTSMAAERTRTRDVISIGSAMARCYDRPGRGIFVP